MHLLKLILKSGGKKGVPQGGVISPLLSNIYLNEVDKMLERAKEVTRDRYTHLEYARFADDLVVLVYGCERHHWIVEAVNKRLREEFAKLQVQVNEEKTQQVDLRRDESFGFLGFKFRRVRSLKGVWRPRYTPLLIKRTELLRKLKVEFYNLRSQPTENVIEVINPILRGWVNYFAWGNSDKCFYYIRNWVEKKVRRHLMRSRQRKGFGWKRWSSQWIYKELGLFNDYHVRRPNLSMAKAVPA
jgi:RNA-directed DNA polymerase